MIARIIDNNTIEVYDLMQFDVDAIMHSGQVFRYFKKDYGYQIVVGHNYAELQKDDNKVVIKSNDANFFYNYFDLQTDYNEIKKELYRFEAIRSAVEAGGGIRIIRSECIETIISFIISANNNIKRFTKTLNLISERYGDKLQSGLFAFPTLKQLSIIEKSDFDLLGCGYRSLYLFETIKMLEYMDITKLSKLRSEEIGVIRKKLMTLPGVGQKVADCVMLMSDLLPNEKRFLVCPKDVHINRALGKLGKEKADELLHHNYSGVIQQYIFYYVQHLEKELIYDEELSIKK